MSKINDNPATIGGGFIRLPERVATLSNATGTATGPNTANVSVDVNVGDVVVHWRIKDVTPPVLADIQNVNTIAVTEPGTVTDQNPGTLEPNTTYWVGWAIQYADGTFDPTIAVSSSFTTPADTASAPTTISLDNTTVFETLPSGGVVANITADGSPAPTFTITSDGDNKFTISGTQLVTDAALSFATDTSHPVTIQATNASGSTSQAFTITVVEESSGTSSAAYGPEFLGDFREVAAIPSTYTAETGTVTDATPATFDSAVAALNDNDVLRLGDGNYGNKTISGLSPATGVTIVSTNREGAIFGSLTIEDGCANVRIKGIKCTGQIKIEGADDCTIEYCYMNSGRTGRRATNSPVPNGNTWRYCIMDKEWPDGGIAHYERKSDNTTIQNCIIMRAGEDNMKLESASGTTVERCVIYEARENLGGTRHNDGMQVTTIINDQESGGTVWAENITVRRCLVWDPNDGLYRRMQGIFFGGTGYHYRNCTIEQCLASSNQNQRNIGITSLNGTGNVIQDNTCWKGIGYAGGITVQNNVVGTTVFQDGGGGTQTITGNIEGNGSRGSILTSGDTHPTSWRDFKTIGAAAAKGATAFITVLETEWGA